MDVSREFHCPNCGVSLTMSDAMHALALIHRSGANYMATATTDTVVCPRCGHSMGVMDIVEGRHGPKWDAKAFLGLAVGIAIWGGIILLVVRSCS